MTGHARYSTLDLREFMMDSCLGLRRKDTRYDNIRQPTYLSVLFRYRLSNLVRGTQERQSTPNCMVNLVMT